MIRHSDNCRYHYLSNALSVALITSPADYAYAKQHLANQLHVVPVAAINYFEWDKSVDASPLNNQLVREAIAMAINRNPIATTVENGLVAATSIPAIPGWPPAPYEHNPYPYNVKLARKLLAKAGYPNGRGLPTLYIYVPPQTTNPEFVPMAEAIAEQEKLALNINFKIATINATLWNQLSNQACSKASCLAT